MPRTGQQPDGQLYSTECRFNDQKCFGCKSKHCIDLKEFERQSEYSNRWMNIEPQMRVQIKTAVSLESLIVDFKCPLCRKSCSRHNGWPNYSCYS
jgi:hypothetical protein